MAVNLSRPVTRPTPTLIDSCKYLVLTMGVPNVEATCEAEA